MEHTNHKDAITAAFKSLKTQFGNRISTRQNFECCQTCGSYALKDSDMYVFYHHQDNDAFAGGKDLVRSMYLAFNAKADADEIPLGEAIVKALKAEGLNVEWDGTIQHRIGILPGWAVQPVDHSFVDLAAR